MSAECIRQNFQPSMPFEPCRVYWGSHGCDLWRDHLGPHVCLTCWSDDGDNEGYVGVPPYYGPSTTFYGADAEARGDGA